MKKYACKFFLFLLAPIFLMSFNLNHIDIATAADSDGNISKDFGNLSTNAESIITLPLPKACVYDDGEDPKARIQMIVKKLATTAMKEL